MRDVLILTLGSARDCMRIVADDPVGASAMLSFDNVGDVSVSAAVVSATILDDNDAEVASIDVSPATFGPYEPAEQADVTITKDAGSLAPA